MCIAVPHGRKLRGAVMAFIAESSAEFPLVKLSITFMALQCPGKWAVGGWCTWMTQTDIRNVKGKSKYKEMCREGEAMMQTELSDLAQEP